MGEMPEYLKEAVEFIKTCPYKGTHFKVELEGDLNRDGGKIECSMCAGRGYRFCRDCNNGFIDGTRKLICKVCLGWFRIPCIKCNQNGTIKTLIMGEAECELFILNKVTPEAREALTYNRFYRDGSVGSEFTFTLPLDQAYYAVEFVKAFKSLADHIGAGLNTDGAGMHLSILNNKKGGYPSGNKTSPICVQNFREAMHHFIPTMYFLGSTSFRSRGLSFRGPSIETGKSHIINYRAGGYGTFEYRVFETCYERPEAVLDDLCVIAKTLKFYKKEPTKLPFFGKIGALGIRDGLGVHRFYFTPKHLKALEEGLKYLKPDHKTVEQLKRERNFTVTPERLKMHDIKFDLKTEQEWRSYKTRLVRDRRIKQKGMQGDYRDLVKVKGRSWVLAHYGTLGHYIKKGIPSTQTLKIYKDTKKKEELTRKIYKVIKI